MRDRLLPILLLLVSLLGCGGTKDADKASPVIYDFRPGRANLNPGSSTLLLANFVGGSGTIDQGIGPVTSGVPIPISPSATTTYTLTVKATTGDPAVASTTVSVGPMSVDITPAQISLVTGQSQAFTANVTGLVDTRVTWAAEGGVIDVNGVFIAGATPGTYLVSAQSKAEPSLCAKAFVTVLAAPIAVAVNPAAPILSVGHLQAFTAQVTGTLNSAVTWSASAGSITAAGVFTAPAAAGSVTVTATSVADPTKSASAVVNVVALPAITAFTLTDIGSSAPNWVLNATFSGGTGTVDQGAGAIASGGQITLGITHADVYILTVTNAAGDSVTRTASAISIAIESPSSPTSILPGRQLTVLYTVFNATNTAVTFTATRGTITAGGAFTAPMSVGACQITVTSQADPTVTVTLTVNVVPLVMPQSQVVAPNASFVFRAPMLGVSNTGVIWSISPATFGTISSQGVFTSNGTTGSFTVTAASAADPTVMGTAFVTVQPGFAYTNTVSATGGTAITTRRTQHALTRTAADLVLASGGLNSGVPTTSLELYNGSGQFWTVSGASLTAARSRHTATLLPTGLILIAGGRGASGAPLNSAEVYDPSFDTFRTTPGPMAAAREDHTATLMQDGRVLITGGRGASGTLPSAEIYDPATNAFTPVAGAMTDARVGHSAVPLLDGRILVAGGSKDGTDANLSLAADLFNPASGTFAPASGPMNFGRRNMGVALAPDGKVTLLGGVFTPSVALVNAGGQQFNPASGTFATLTSSMSAGRNRPLFTILADGSMLALGGSSDLGASGDQNGAAPVGTLDVFNPISTAFPTSGFNLPPVGADPLGSRCMLMYDGTVVFVGDALDGAGAPVGSVVYQ